MQHKIFCALPSARGIEPATSWNIFDMRTCLEKAGHAIFGSSVYRMPLGLARNEMLTVALGTEYRGEPTDVHMYIDDDVQLVDARDIVALLAVLDAGADIISAPCRLRDHEHGGVDARVAFNVHPCSEPETIGGLRTVECMMTGLGLVLVKRHVMQHLFDAEPKKYVSRIMPNALSAAVFTENVECAADLIPDGPKDLFVYALDDVQFSKKVRALGYKIHAAIDIPTVHAGMRGKFSAEIEKAFEKEKALEREKIARPRAVLLDAQGRPVVSR